MNGRVHNNSSSPRFPPHLIYHIPHRPLGVQCVAVSRDLVFHITFVKRMLTQHTMAHVPSWGNVLFYELDTQFLAEINLPLVQRRTQLVFFHLVSSVSQRSRYGSVGEYVNEARSRKIDTKKSTLRMACSLSLNREDTHGAAAALSDKRERCSNRE